MGLHAISDLHLGGPGGARLFDDAAQGPVLAALCERVAREPDGELVLAGDILDLTALCPPARGLGAFGKALDLYLEDKPAPGVAQRCQAVRAANPVALGALERLAERVPVTLVPGNHDRHLGEPGGAEALAAAGLGRVRIEPGLVRTLDGRVVVVRHGHDFDAGNRSPGCGGEVMTGVLHHAVLPFLRRLPGRPNVRVDAERLVALRPEERVVPVLERWLPPGLFERFLDAFLELLVENGYLSRVASLLATRGLVRARLRHDDDLWESTGRAALEALSGARELPGRPPPADALVLGHTHVSDWAVHEGRAGAQRLYVNLGTWTHRATDAAGPLDRTLPEIDFAVRDGRFVAVLRDLEDGSELQRFEAG